MASTFLNIPNSGSASWKDPVANVAALPLEGNSLNDARSTEDTQTIYVWSGSAWVVAGASDAGISQLTGDVTAGPGSGSQAATVVSVGGSSASAVSTAVGLVNAATAANAPNTLVKRDGAGNIAGGTFAASVDFIGPLIGNVTGNVSGTAGNITGTTNTTITTLSSLSLPGLQVTSTAEFSNGSSSTVNFANGPSQVITLGSNITITFANPTSGSAYVLRFVQGSGSYTVTWPATVKWPVASGAPAISLASGAVDIINLYYNGTSYYGTFAQTFG